MTAARLLTASLALAGGALIVTAAPRPAAALNAVCVILSTPDGFAALRTRPDIHAPVIARMKTDHNIHMRSVTQGRLVRSGRWVQVTYWPNGELPAPTDPAYRLGRLGWVAQSLVGDCG